MKIRLYTGKKARDIDLAGRSSFSVGSRYNDTVRLPEEVARGVSVDLERDGNGWTASCRGNVTCRGRQVQRLAFETGCVLVLNAAYGVAIEAVESDDEGVSFPLEGRDVVTIGRDARNSIKFLSDTVTAVHATLSRAPDGWYVTDSSRNGTYLNGRRIKRALLNDGDSIMIGEFTVRFLGSLLKIFGGGARQGDGAKKARARREYPYFESAPRILPVKRQEEIEIQDAPNIGGAPNVNWFFVLLPTLLMVLFYTFYAVIQRSASFLMMMPMMLMGVVMSAFNHRSQKKRYKQLTKLRKEKYEAYIAQTSDAVDKKNKQQLELLASDNPSPDRCLAVVRERTGRLWNRKPEDPDFLCVRLGTGKIPSETTIKIPTRRIALEEDEFEGVPEKVKQKYSVIDGAPVLCDLKKYSALGVVGPRGRVCSLVRGMAVEIASCYRYDEVKLVFLFPEKEKNEWEWTRWLPHCFDETRSARYLACTEYDANEVCRELTAIFKERAAGAKDRERSGEPLLPHYVIAVADTSLIKDPELLALLDSQGGALGFSSIFLKDVEDNLPRGTNAVVSLDASGGCRLNIPQPVGETIEFAADEVPVNFCDVFARTVAPVRLPERADEYLLPACVTFLEGFNVTDASELKIADNWRRIPEGDSLAVPIGVRTNGERFFFDIHEKHHGPHGLVAGMTGSGKSEMVQSWILAMALRFSPRDVSFVIIDFKGTGLILPFANLPHLAGAVSNLDVNISRNLIALESELQRRQALFDRAGVNNIEKYRRLYREGQVKEPLSYLVVVIDEYAEFKVKFPDFTNEVNSLFRTGRSLGISVVLLTQNPSGIVSAQSEDNVKFRWCLKVAGAVASKEMLGRPDAAKLLVPGRAYVKVGEDEVYELIQSFWSGAPFRDRNEERAAPAPRVSLVGLRGNRTRLAQAAQDDAAGRGVETEIDTVMREIIRTAREEGGLEARKIWQQRLKRIVFLDDIPAASDEAAGLRPVVGAVDNPYEQKQGALCLPLDEGHVAVYGAPGSGKTTLLQTLVTSLCCGLSPDDVNVCILDFGGWNFRCFEGFPHVSAVASGSEEDKVTAVVKNVLRELEQRKELFAKSGVGNIEAYRRATHSPLPQIVVIVDNFAPVLQTYPELEGFFRDVSLAGGSYGIVFVFTCNSPVSLGFKIKQNIKTSIALNMPDRSDYVDIVGRTEGLEPENVKGRGLCRQNGAALEFQTALPARDEGDENRVKLLQKLGEELGEKWGGKRAKTVKTMPKTVTVSDLEGAHLAVGLCCETLEPLPVGLCGGEHTLAVSAPDGCRERVLYTLMKTGAEAGEAVLFGGEAGAQGLRRFADAAGFDSYVEGLMDRLNERKNGGEAQPFSPIYIFVDNWRQSYEALSDETIKRLHRVVRSAKNLGVFLTVLGDCEDFVRLVGLGDALSGDLVKGNAIVAGGSLSESSFIESNLPYDQRSQRLCADDGWFIHNKTALKFKLADREDGHEQ